MIPGLVSSLRAEARDENERRLLVLTGSHDTTLDTAVTALSTTGPPGSQSVLISRESRPGTRHVRPVETRQLLGTTIDTLVYDAHTELRPNSLARALGAVAGGGLILLCCPPLDVWPSHRDEFDKTLAVPPHTVAAVSGHFRDRFVDTLKAHPGIGIVNVDTETIVKNGHCTCAPPLGRTQSDRQYRPDTDVFPRTAYDACLTADQASALNTLEALTTEQTAVVLESDRGRGKSSVIGLAAASFALAGEQVGITAPRYEHAHEALTRAAALLDHEPEATDHARDPPKYLDAPAGGSIEFTHPRHLAETDPSVLFVDEAAAIPLPDLEASLRASRVAFATTVHGYEGTGRGFAVRFGDRLTESPHSVTSTTLTEPIRYAPGDPIEKWAFRAFLLDATPATDQLVSDATPDTVQYQSPTPDVLKATEPLLREVFGLLVSAHYRTEPNDFARLLDAPNIHVRTLTQNDHVASVALLATEGGLSAETRSTIYAGTRIQGNMIPDLLASQLRDETAPQLRGIRILRIATHPARRSNGLGSALLTHIRHEFDRTHDWLGASFGATPALISFWARNGYSTIHVSTTRNDASGEHSVVMMSPLSPDGEAVHDRHASWFATRIAGVLSDALSNLNPELARLALRATDTTVPLELTERDWRHIASMAYGPGLIDIDPGPFRHLARKHLIDPTDPTILTPHQERLLVAKVLQGADWESANGSLASTDSPEFHSRSHYYKTLGKTYQRLTEAYGSPAARTERDRYQSTTRS